MPTPAPSTAATSFFNFTPMNPFSPQSGAGATGGGSTDFNLEDMFIPPLPNYDTDILQRMQELPTQWQDIAGMNTLPEAMMPDSANMQGAGELDWFSQLAGMNTQTTQSAYGQYWPSQ